MNKRAQKPTNKKVTSKDEIKKVLKEVRDPELGVNIVDLGLIYEIKTWDDSAHIKMTLTYPGCPLGGYITEQVKKRLESLPEVKKAHVELVWEPIWTPDRIEKKVREELHL